MPKYEVHPVHWSQETVMRYWNTMAKRLTDEDYFSRRYGASIVRWATKHGAELRGRRVLDFGCGPGFLLEHLATIAQPGALFGTDSSPESRRLAGKRLQRHGFRDVVLDIEGLSRIGHVDAAFAVEVVEHLDDQALAEVLRVLGTSVKPSGHLIVTTPNEELLDRDTHVCPECGCEYHQWQHVRSWSASSLSSVLERAGFRTLQCEALTLRPNDLALGSIAAEWMRRALGRYRRPHLLWVGSRC